MVEGFQAAYITYSSYQGQDLSIAIIQAGYFLFQVSRHPVPGSW